jgi:lactoylglutathione lyase
MIALLVIKTNQLEKQKIFHKKLDLLFQKEKHGNSSKHFNSMIASQSTVLQIYPLPNGQTLLDTTTRLGFRVDDLEKTIDTILKIGGEIKNKIREMEFGKLAVMKDFDERSIEVYQKKMLPY